METKAYFSNILDQLKTQITSSKDSIKIAVAWFTNKELLGYLTDMQKKGVNIKIVVSDDEINKRIQPNEIIKHGGYFNIISSNKNKFLHSKFAIFDNKTLITGSYNYTYFAEYKNFESIIVSSSQIIMEQFTNRFNYLFNLSKPYNTKLFVQEKNIIITSIEEQYINLESDLKDDLINIWKESGKINKKYQNDYIISFIEKYGAIGACKRLMSSGENQIQSGLIKMWEINRLDLTFEYIISKEKYKYLFDNHTIDVAIKRLNKLNFKP